MKKFLFVVLGLIIVSSGIVAAEATSINTSITTVSIWDMIIFRGDNFVQPWWLPVFVVDSVHQLAWQASYSRSIRNEGLF